MILLAQTTQPTGMASWTPEQWITFLTAVAGLITGGIAMVRASGLQQTATRLSNRQNTQASLITTLAQNQPPPPANPLAVDEMVAEMKKQKEC